MLFHKQFTCLATWIHESYVLMQDTLTHSLLICKVSKDLIDSLDKDKKVMEEIPGIKFDSSLYEQVVSV